ncbi:hypothetical protein BDF21DRAFT_402491 [Thamnidium elegans]|nr:hypothetical protein BDF21DRAFT_402491 [Thamnidium elegans]
MKQTTSESPQMYLSRLHEAADLADIQDDKMIFSRFRAGLLPQIIVFCKEQAASSHKDWVKNSNAWWNAHAVKPIHLVDNPFASGDYYNGNNAEAYANVISPSIANITAKLEALELYSLIPSTGSKGNIDDNISQATNIKSLLSNNEFKSLIKNIVQEVNNERVTPYMPYKNNRKPFYNNENFDQGFQNSYQRNNGITETKIIIHISKIRINLTLNKISKIKMFIKIIKTLIVTIFTTILVIQIIITLNKIIINTEMVKVIIVMINKEFTVNPPILSIEKTIKKETITKKTRWDNC